VCCRNLIHNLLQILLGTEAMHYFLIISLFSFFSMHHEHYANLTKLLKTSLEVSLYYSSFQNDWPTRCKRSVPLHMHYLECLWPLLNLSRPQLKNKASKSAAFHHFWFPKYLSSKNHHFLSVKNILIIQINFFNCEELSSASVKLVFYI